MGLFNKVFGNNNSQPVNSDPKFEFISNFLAGSDDFNPNDKDVENVSSDIYAITSRIANDVSNIPIISNNQYVSQLLSNHINQYMSAHDWEVATLMNLLLWGDSYSLIETGDNGTISDILLLPNYEVTANINANGVTYDYALTGDTFSDSQILHFKLNSVDGLMGTSPLIALKNTLMLSRASNRLLRSYYDNSAFNKVLLQVDDKLSADDRKKIKDAFSDNMGSNHAGGTIVSDDTVKVQPFNTSNVGANVIKETKNGDYFAKKICAVYGVPSALLGVINPHSNGQSIDFQYQQALKPYENIIVSELNNKLNGSYTIKEPVHIQSATDVANLVKNGAIDSTQAQDLLGLTNN